MKVKHQYLMTCVKLAVILKLTGQSLTCLTLKSNLLLFSLRASSSASDEKCQLRFSFALSHSQENKNQLKLRHAA